jgi:hypothetical protein
MDAETRQQLYGGEITDYLPKPQEKELKDDYKAIENIYLNLKKKSFSLDTGDNFNNKLK